MQVLVRLRTYFDASRETAIPFQPRRIAALLPVLTLGVAALLAFASPSAAQPSAKAPSSLELSRAVRPWEFLPITGTKAALFGNEAGQMEAWVYPLKVLRNFHLEFKIAGRVLPAEALARTIITRPESSTILYTSDTFLARETFFVPMNEPGIVVTIQINTSEPLEVRAIFERDFQLEWPAALAATFGGWNPDLHAFSFGEERKQYAALVGSPSADHVLEEYQTNSSASSEDSFSLGVTEKGEATKVVVVAGSVTGVDDAQTVYHRLTADYGTLQKEAAGYYRNYLEKTVGVELPDPQLQQAYDWSRVSVLQGLVTNPFLGTGFVAGYRTSGNGQRPGFAWFFGRDALWTSFALNSEGDYASTRTALNFLSKFQRDDGKIPHEISQSASLVDWFKNYPYPFASADATPLYIIAMSDYANESGDVAFVQQKWDSMWKAYQFLHSTYDDSGLPKNLGVGHGWVEGGPLLPVSSEFYQTGLGAEALRALSQMAHSVGKEDVSKQLAEEFAQQQVLLEKAFWLPEKQRFAFAIGTNGNPVDEPSVLATVPMWFGLVDEKKADSMISELAGPGHEADWGMRIISSAAQKYDPSGYHFGSIWPLFTGWASVGEYRYHRALPAYLNLRANALLALDGSLGHVTEVLSGDYYQTLATGSPHQIWSAAMVVSPLLRGMLGLSSDATAHRLTFAPHVPADWNKFALKNVRAGECNLDLRYQRDDSNIELEATRSDAGGACEVEFSPAIGIRADVTGAQLNGRSVPFKVVQHEADQHVSMRLAINRGKNVMRIGLRNDFELGVNSDMPALGSSSAGLRVLSESWTLAHDRLELDLAGISGKTYEMSVRGSLHVSRVEGGELEKAADGAGKLRIRIPAGKEAQYEHAKISFLFAAKHR